jgi:hypothetical protein
MSGPLATILATIGKVSSMLARLRPGAGEDLTELDPAEEMELPESVRRARAWVGKGRYCLGAGGRDPKAADPWGPCVHPKEHSHAAAGRVFCDCSGFQAWIFGLPRKSRDGVWFYTDALAADAAGQVKGDLGDGIPWAQAQPGDLVVYGAGPRVGHVGLVSACDATGPSRVIHCQSRGRVAVVETGPQVFVRNRAVVLRLR